MKKLFCICLSLLCVLCLLTGCTQQNEKTELTAYTAGTYEGVSMNGKGGKITVEVTFTEDAITEIVVKENDETPSIAAKPFEEIPAAIIENQSLAIDSITGATLTSVALLEAIEDAVTKAGGDVEALKSVEVKKIDKDEIVELESEIIIVGAGTAGLSAALTAGNMGASSVTVFEKNSITGGNLRICEGLFATSGLTENLKATRTNETDAYLARIIENGPQDEAEKEIWDKFESDYNEWLASGSDKVFDSAEFNMIEYGRADGMGVEAYRYYALNSYEFFPWFIEETNTSTSFETGVGAVGFQWPRFTYITGHPADGEGYVEVIEETISSKNYPVDVYTSTPVTELVTDENGKVTGVVAVSDKGVTYHATATKGVIIATGGYSANGEMVEQYNQWYEGLTKDIKTDNVPTDDGDGINMAMAIGAAVENMEVTSLLPITSAVTGRLDSLIGDLDSFMIVNNKGLRFVDETITRLEITLEILAQDNNIAYIIRDKNTCGITNGMNTRGRTEESMIVSGEILKGESIEELAEKIGCDAKTLEESIIKFNDACDNGNDEFGRILMDSSDKLMEGPYYAYPISPAVHITFGGLSTDNNGHVYNTDGEIIEGLYAAGEVCNNSGGIDFALPQGYVVAKYILSK